MGVSDPLHGSGFRNITTITIMSWLFWFIVVWINVINPLIMQKRHKNFTENELPKIRENQLEMAQTQQKESGLPTQEILEQIADKFGFTLTGQFLVNHLGYFDSEFEMETHKSLDELTEMGIHTFRDIFKDYYLFFEYQPLRYKNKVIRDEELNAKYVSDENNVFFEFTYKSKYEENKNIVWDKDYIIQIKKDRGYSKKGYTVYRDSGIVVRDSVDELTDNEKLFIITAKDNGDNPFPKGTMKTGFFDISAYYENMFQVSPNEPLLLK